MTKVVAAVDLGATSGRVMLGYVEDGMLRLEQVARFPNGPVAGPDGLHWDFTALYRHVIDGLAEAVRREPGIASIGIDSWAVDYGLVHGDELLAEPFHYRDDRTARGVETVHAKVPFEELYRRNGLQFLPFNTLYQYAVDRRLADAEIALLIPDLVAFLLTGARVAERTNASTTGLVDVASGEWDRELAARLGIPAGPTRPEAPLDASGPTRPEAPLDAPAASGGAVGTASGGAAGIALPQLVDPGTRLGRLRGEARERVGAAIDVIAVGSHDTASAVVAVPLSTPNAAYISCGTWGLVGVELDEPVVTDAAREANFTNEGGVDGRVRFLHNVTGLWLLSESVRTWEAEDGAPIDLPQLLDAAAAVDGTVPLFDANDARLAAPGDMPARIAAVIEESGAAVPASRPAFARTIVESIAQAFANAVSTAGRLTARDIDVIHIVGGGALNRLLCQATADRSALPVLAGPVEATALGNVLVQARAHGWFGPDATLEDLRRVVAGATAPVRYEPRTDS